MNPFTALQDFFLEPEGRLRRTRILLIAFALFLTGVGIAFVHSTTSAQGAPFPSPDALSQMRNTGVALLVLLAVIAIDYRFIERSAFPIYIVLVAVLVGLLIAKTAMGLDLIRWIPLGGINIQPSELMKLSLILALARYLKFRSDTRRITGLIPPLLLTLVPFFLVMAQPNLGTALMFPPILLGMLFLGGARKGYLAAAILVGLLVFLAVYLASEYVPILKPYQKERITQFFSNSQYQLQQSILAVRWGGVVGMGYHQGDQNTLGFLPYKHTDFIFAIICEEWGFVGASLIVLVFFLLVILCLVVALHTREPFGRLLAVAVAMSFAAQGLENIGMNLGITPITGVPLPFISLGGSSLVTSFLALGLVLNVAFRNVRVVASQDLNPVRESRVMIVIDDHPAGAQRFPER